LADQPLKSTLQFLNDNGHLNNTALFILGDHGTGLGPIVKTEQGKLELQFPALYIVLPPWFKVKHPIAWKNLRSNQDKLVSSFDMHRTLLQMKNLEERSVFDTNPNPSIDKTEIKGPTLFHKISPYLALLKFIRLHTIGRAN
jgi:arylsulfatase A-like enzyme